jgi:DNA-binding MarR family transcriptional regulator
MTERDPNSPSRLDSTSSIEPDPRRSPDSVVAAAANWSARGWDPGNMIGAALSILRAESIIRQTTIELLRPHSLSFSRHEVLALLYFSRSGQIALGRISTRLLVHPTSVTSTVDALERLGYVERTPHPSDRRAILAQITPAGRAAMEASSPELSKLRFGLQAITDDEAATLIRILRKVRSAAGDPVDPADASAADSTHLSDS